MQLQSETRWDVDALLCVHCSAYWRPETFSRPLCIMVPLLVSRFQALQVFFCRLEFRVLIQSSLHFSNSILLATELFQSQAELPVSHGQSRRVAFRFLAEIFAEVSFRASIVFAAVEQSASCAIVVDVVIRHCFFCLRDYLIKLAPLFCPDLCLGQNAVSKSARRIKTYGLLCIQFRFGGVTPFLGNVEPCQSSKRVIGFWIRLHRFLIEAQYLIELLFMQRDLAFGE